ncbi:MAG: hypothetical protein B7733_02050 [Myxococcales bacterium FL481]|nr:MAG: hypothetical protein B7733_02050 [Myxococcales bacterium FL481]
MNRTSVPVMLLVAGLVVSGAGILGLACEGTAPQDYRRQLLRSWVEDSLLPRYAVAAEHAGRLAEGASSFCASPSGEQLGALQLQWHLARAAWKQTQIFGFGPYSELPLRLGPKIDEWPARPEAVNEAIDAGVPIDLAFVESLGVYARGFSATEYLLWGQGGDALAELSEQARRCRYLVAASQDLHARLQDLHVAWNPQQGDFLSELTEAGRDSETYDSLHVAFGEVVNRMGFLVEDIRRDKLGRPLGVTSNTGPDPLVVESLFSGRSVDDIRDNLIGFERLFFGERDGEGGGLNGYLERRGKNFGPPVAAALARVRATLDEIRSPLSQAVVEQGPVVQRAIDELAELQRLIQSDIMNTLSLTLSFNDNDGD